MSEVFIFHPFIVLASTHFLIKHCLIRCLSMPTSTLWDGLISPFPEEKLPGVKVVRVIGSVSVKSLS